MAAGLACAEVIDALPGKVQVIGTPAEEGGGGKVLMTQRGVFERVDAAMMFHPGDETAIRTTSLAATTCAVRIFTARPPTPPPRQKKASTRWTR